MLFWGRKMKVYRAAILTAKEVEFDAVRQHLIEEQRADDTFDGTVYRRAKIRRNLGSDVPVEHWDVAIYRTGRGQQPSTYSTQLLVHHFRPDIVLYVGVAGGDPNCSDLSIGDVVVAKLVRYYERTSQKVNHFVIKDETHSPNRALISAAEYEADEGKWLERISGNRRGPNVFVEEIASGEKVQKSASSVLWIAIKERYPDVIAVETEGHGFHYAAIQSATRALMIRSISDMLDNKDDDTTKFGSDDERQALASSHAAAFAINLIVNLNTRFLEDTRAPTPASFALEQSITRGLFARALDEPTNVWKEVLDDACKAQRSIYTAITVKDFSAPKHWDETLSSHLENWYRKNSREIPYKVAIFRHKSDISDDDIDRLLSINNTYTSRKLKAVTHGFIYQLHYFQFSIIVIDSLHVGFLWNADGGDTSTTGIYFRDAPYLAQELNLWFARTCEKTPIEDVRDIAKRRGLAINP